jgi:hypothetical protein
MKFFSIALALIWTSLHAQQVDQYKLSKITDKKTFELPLHFTTTPVQNQVNPSDFMSRNGLHQTIMAGP